MTRESRTALLESLFSQRILILDGAMGTMIQTFKLTEADFRGQRFADFTHDLRGNNDLLTLTQPDIIRSIHSGYLEAGADIIETNTFNSNAASMADYHMQDLVYELNVAAAKLAREAAQEYEAKTPNKPRFVAGVIGIIFSFWLCGVIAISGKHGSAPTMILSRAAFGVEGQKLPSAISWILTVGWETVLTILATLATATVFERLGWGGGTTTKLIAMVVVSVIIIGAGVLGFDTIMKVQTWITYVTGILTVGYFLLVWDKVDWNAINSIPTGSAQSFIGALIFSNRKAPSLQSK